MRCRSGHEFKLLETDHCMGKPIFKCTRCRQQWVVAIGHLRLTYHPTKRDTFLPYRLS